MLSFARCQALRALCPNRSGIALRIAAGLLLTSVCNLTVRAQATNPDAAFLNESPASTPAPAAVPETSVQPEPVLSPEPAPTPGPAAPTDLTPLPAPRAENSPAKAPSDAVISTIEVRDVSVKKADIDSPFFTERQEAKSALAREGREGTTASSQTPVQSSGRPNCLNRIRNRPPGAAGTVHSTLSTVRDGGEIREIFRGSSWKA